MEMYAGRLACCSLVSRVEYVPHALLRLEKKMGLAVGWLVNVQGRRRGHWAGDPPWDRRTPDHYIMLTTRRGQSNNFDRVINNSSSINSSVYTLSMFAPVCQL